MNTEMTDLIFRERVKAELREIAPTFTAPDTAAHSADPMLYRYVEDYFCRRQLFSAATALPLVLWILTNSESNENALFSNVETRIEYYRRCLSVCRMLIDLNIPLSKEEEDILFCATICHILPDVMHYRDLQGELVNRFRWNPAVYEIVRLCYRDEKLVENNKSGYFTAIQENKLALLLKLAARGNLIAQFHDIPVYNVRGYIHETRSFYFPMCIFGKEYYPQLQACISVLMEKMRSLMEIAEILLSRYEARENELTQQILALQEDNASLRMMIRRMKDAK